MAEILTSIMTIMTSTTSSLSESFFESVLKRLDVLGYTVTQDDVWVLCFTAQQVESKVKSSCNTIIVPEGLFFDTVDMVCGEFLFMKKKTGKLVGFDFGTAVKQIQEGDTSMTFVDGLTAEQQFEAVIESLKTKADGQAVSFRRLAW